MMTLGPVGSTPISETCDNSSIAVFNTSNEKGLAKVPSTRSLCISAMRPAVSNNDWSAPLTKMTGIPRCVAPSLLITSMPSISPSDKSRTTRSKRPIIAASISLGLLADVASNPADSATATINSQIASSSSMTRTFGVSLMTFHHPHYPRRHALRQLTVTMRCTNLHVRTALPKYVHLVLVILSYSPNSQS